MEERNIKKQEYEKPLIKKIVLGEKRKVPHAFLSSASCSCSCSWGCDCGCVGCVSGCVGCDSY